MGSIPAPLLPSYGALSNTLDLTALRSRGPSPAGEGLKGSLLEMLLEQRLAVRITPTSTFDIMPGKGECPEL